MITVTADVWGWRSQFVWVSAISLGWSSCQPL